MNNLLDAMIAAKLAGGGGGGGGGEVTPASIVTATGQMTAEQTADFTIYINMTTLMDIKPAFASRIAVIDGVTLSGT